MVMDRVRTGSLVTMMAALCLPTPARAGGVADAFENARQQAITCMRAKDAKCVESNLETAAKLAVSINDTNSLNELKEFISYWDSSLNDWMDKFCLTFKQISPGSVPTMIKQMESSPYSVEIYFNTPRCQPEGYSNMVKSPLIHIVADDPNARESFLKSVFAYYSKKRKQPELFTVALNAKNTKGETLLDYFEMLRQNGINKSPEQMVVIEKLIVFSCEHGAIYSRYQNLTCPIPLK